jgi:hypothetical protein
MGAKGTRTCFSPEGVVTRRASSVTAASLNRFAKVAPASTVKTSEPRTMKAVIELPAWRNPT